MKEIKNREFSFRVWDRKNKKWLEEVPPLEYMLNSDSWDHLDPEDVLIDPAKPFPQFNDRLIWQQYIGINDRNGKRIYEGDIVSIKKENNTQSSLGDEEYDRIGVVVFGIIYGFQAFMIEEHNRQKDGIMHFQDCEVTGNIFEIPIYL